MIHQTVYLVRHAQSTMKDRYCGSTDALLSDLGIKQAKRLARFFRSLPIDLCFYSDMKRTKLTAGYLKRDGIVFVPAPEIREIDFGDWERLKFSSAAERWPEVYKRWVQSPATVDIPSGERFRDFAGRVESFYKKLLKTTAKNIVVVAHGGSVSVLSMILLKKPLSDFWKWTPPNASISIFKRSGTGETRPFKIVRAKDVSHLND